MAIGAFPLAKLGFVLVKQISKPIANGIASRARKSKVFRDYVCIPVAQLFHWYDVKIRMRVLNLGKVSNVPKLDEKKAIETGAQLLSEFILVAVASAIVIYEYNRSSQKEEERQYQIELEKKEIRERIQDLEFTVEKQSTQLKELTRLAIAIRDDLQKSLLPKPSKGFFGKKDTDEVPVVPPISPELMDVFDKDKLNSDRINRNNKTDGDINNIADKIKDVSYTHQDIFNNSLFISKSVLSQNRSDEDLKLDDNVPGPITKIVAEHFKSTRYELFDV